jgi:hypothetical protein
LGFVIGILGALKALSANTGAVSLGDLAGGFNTGLLSLTFGIVIFLIGKLFKIILTWMKK